MARDSNLEKILAQEMRKNLDEREAIYYGLDSELNQGSSEIGNQINSILKDVVRGADKTTLEALRLRKQRLEQARKVLDSANLQEEEMLKLNENIARVQEAITRDIQQRTSIFTKARAAITKSAFGFGALLVAVSKGDPLVAFGASLLGNYVKSRKEKKLQQESERRETLRSDLEGFSGAAAKDLMSESKPLLIEPSSYGEDLFERPLRNRSEESDNSIIEILALLLTTNQKMLTVQEDILAANELMLEMQNLDIQRKRRGDIESELESRYSSSGKIFALPTAETSKKGGILKNIGGVVQAIGGAVGGIGTGILGGLLGVLGLKGLVSGGAGLAKVLKLSNLGKFGGLVARGASAPVALATLILGASYDIFSSLFSKGDLSKSKIFQFINGAEDFLIGKMGGISESAKEEAQRARGLLGFPFVGVLVGGVIGGIKDMLVHLWTGTQEKLSNSQYVQDSVGFIFEDVAGFFKGLIEGFFNGVKSLAEGVFGYIPGFKEKVDSITVRLKDAILPDALKPSDTLTADEIYRDRLIKEMDKADSNKGEYASLSQDEKDALLRQKNQEFLAQKEKIKNRIKKLNYNTKENRSQPSLSKQDNETILLNEIAAAGITDPVEIAALMAQAAHESGNFKYMKEIPSAKSGLNFENYDFKGKGSLGNMGAGDGAKYRGRGHLQITGRDNYTRIGKMIGIDLENHPELLEDPVIAAKASVAYWKMRVSPNVSDFSDVGRVTKLIQGTSTDAIERRTRKFREYSAKLGADSPLQLAANYMPALKRSIDLKNMSSGNKSSNQSGPVTVIDNKKIVNQNINQASGGVNAQTPPVVSSLSPSAIGAIS
jgi:putative chitinase